MYFYAVCYRVSVYITIVLVRSSLYNKCLVFFAFLDLRRSITVGLAFSIPAFSMVPRFQPSRGSTCKLESLNSGKIKILHLIEKPT